MKQGFQQCGADILGFIGVHRYSQVKMGGKYRRKFGQSCSKSLKLFSLALWRIFDCYKRAQFLDILQ